MNQQVEAEFIVSQLRVLRKHLDMVIAKLESGRLRDNDRRLLLKLFKDLTRMRRDALYAVAQLEVFPPGELATFWREFVQTGAAICQAQFEVASARLELPKLSGQRGCVVAGLLVTAARLWRDFEAWECR